MLSKSLTQFSVDGQNCVPSLLSDLRPNYGGGNEDNGDLLQKVSCRHCCTQCPQPCSWPPPTHASANPCLRQRLLDTHGQVWVSLFGVTAPFSWVLVCTRFCLCPPRVCVPVLSMFGHTFESPYYTYESSTYESPHCKAEINTTLNQHTL